MTQRDEAVPAYDPSHVNRPAVRPIAQMTPSDVAQRVRRHTYKHMDSFHARGHSVGVDISHLRISSCVPLKTATHPLSRSATPCEGQSSLSTTFSLLGGAVRRCEERSHPANGWARYRLSGIDGRMVPSMAVTSCNENIWANVTAERSTNWRSTQLDHYIALPWPPHTHTLANARAFMRMARRGVGDAVAAC